MPFPTDHFTPRLHTLTATEIGMVDKLVELVEKRVIALE